MRFTLLQFELNSCDNDPFKAFAMVVFESDRAHASFKANGFAADSFRRAADKLAAKNHSARKHFWQNNWS